MALQAPLSKGFFRQEYWIKNTAIFSSRVSSTPSDWTCVSYVSCTAADSLPTELLGKPNTLQFKSEFGNKELMIWATVSTWSCFCWLYRASPSLAAKNMINLILVSTIWWCPCVESSLLLLEEGVFYPVHSPGKTLLTFALLYSVLHGQICLLLWVFLDFLLLHSSPL